MAEKGNGTINKIILAAVIATLVGFGGWVAGTIQTHIWKPAHDQSIVRMEQVMRNQEERKQDIKEMRIDIRVMREDVNEIKSLISRYLADQKRPPANQSM